MLDLLDSQKKAFYTYGAYMTYHFRFLETEMVIDNETLHSESVTIKESICDEEDLILGGCIASSCEFEVSGISEGDIAGLEFDAEIKVENKGFDFVVPMGRYRVDSAKKVDDQDYRKIVAYDALYDASVDVSEWYNALFPLLRTDTVKKKDEDGNDIIEEIKVYGTVSLKEMRESLLNYLHIPYVEQSLPNDNMLVEKTIEAGAGSLIGTSVLKNICTVHGGFGRINREGRFEVLYLKKHGLYPAETLYPDESLYPSESNACIGQSDEEKNSPDYQSISFEEYETQQISCLLIKTEEEDAGCMIGENIENSYLLMGNFLLYGKTEMELKEIGKPIYDVLKDVWYRPNTVVLDGLPYIEVGDAYEVEMSNDVVEAFVIARSLSGIQNLNDTFEIKGNKVRANDVSKEIEIKQLKAKMLKIKKEVDGFSINLSDMEEQTASSFEQTASEIVLKVDSKGNAVEVALGVDPDDKTATLFKVSAGNIDLKAADVIRLLAGGTLDLSGKKIKIDSNNFSVTEEGEVEAKAINITGGSVSIETAYDAEDKVEFNYKNNNGSYKKVSMARDGIGYKDYENNVYYSHGSPTYYQNVDEAKISGSSLLLNRTLGYFEGGFRLLDGALNMALKFAVYDGGYFPYVDYDIPVKAPNINVFQKVTVTSSTTVASGKSETIVFEINSMEGASAYTAIPQTWSWCSVSSITISGTEGKVKLTNITGATHTLSATLLILPRLEVEE